VNSFENSVNPADSDPIYTITEYIDAHYSEDLRVAELAERFHVCEKQLSHTIKKEYGATAKNLTYESRIKRAAFLLTHYPTLPIHTIAEKIGYSSPEILSIMFKKYFGMSASEYKKRYAAIAIGYTPPEELPL